MSIDHETIDALLAAAQADKQFRASTMPTEAECLLVIHQAYQRLKDLGWKDIMHAPTDGSSFNAIELGCTSILQCQTNGRSTLAAEAGDLWPCRPSLFRHKVRDQAADTQDSSGDSLCVGAVRVSVRGRALRPEEIEMAKALGAKPDQTLGALVDRFCQRLPGRHARSARPHWHQPAVGGRSTPNAGARSWGCELNDALLIELAEIWELQAATGGDGLNKLQSPARETLRSCADTLRMLVSAQPAIQASALTAAELADAKAESPRHAAEAGDLASAVSQAINQKLNGGHCPGAGALGECAAVYQHHQCPKTGTRWFYAHVYLWTAGRHVTAQEVADWAQSAGARDITVSHQLHDPSNFISNGICEDGVISWLIEFSDDSTEGAA